MAQTLFLLFITPAFWFGVIAGVVGLMALAAATMLVLGWIDEQADRHQLALPLGPPANDDRRAGLSPRQTQLARGCHGGLRRVP